VLHNSSEKEVVLSFYQNVGAGNVLMSDVLLFMNLHSTYTVFKKSLRNYTYIRFHHTGR